MMSKDEKDKAKKEGTACASRPVVFFFFFFGTQVVGNPNKNIVVWVGGLDWFGG